MQARRDAKARDLLLGAVERGDARWCWPVRYELMVDARGPVGVAAVGILHFDQHLERLGDHLGVAAYWISEPS